MWLYVCVFVRSLAYVCGAGVPAGRADVWSASSERITARLLHVPRVQYPVLCSVCCGARAQRCGTAAAAAGRNPCERNSYACAYACTTVHMHLSHTCSAYTDINTTQAPLAQQQSGRPIRRMDERMMKNVSS